MKAIVKTTGGFELFEPQTREHVYAHKPTLVTWTPFLEAHTGRGDVKVFASGLPDDVLAEDFEKFLDETSGDEDEVLIVQAFVSQFNKSDDEPKAEGEEAKPRRKTRRRG